MPLYEFILDSVLSINLEIFNNNAVLPVPSLSELKKLIYSFMPYYTSKDVLLLKFKYYLKLFNYFRILRIY